MQLYETHGYTEHVISPLERMRFYKEGDPKEDRTDIHGPELTQPCCLSIAVMASDNFKSPNAIPPRTSSTGVQSLFASPTKPVLRPVPEADWIAPSKKLHTTTVGMGAPGLDPQKSMSNGTKGDGTTWSAEKEKILLGPYDYMFNQPGKDIRKQLIAAFNQWLKVPERSLAIITKVVGMLHTASLLYV